MPDKIPDYLQLMLETILNRVSEMNESIKESNKALTEYKDQTSIRVSAIESRTTVTESNNRQLELRVSALESSNKQLEAKVTSIETEKNIVKGILSSKWVERVIYLAIAGLMGFMGAKGDVLKGLLEIFK